jgi:dTDP-4-amino-4,6-dideoxygalactose transaminase
MRRFPSRPLPDLSCLCRALFNDIEYENDFLFFGYGRDALVFGLEALKIKPRASILIPAYICDSLLEPLRELGYNIIFFDVNEDLSFNLNIIERLISSSNIKAILTVHYFGFPCYIDALSELCKRYNVRVIEDCSHSYLTQIAGNPIGSLSDIAIYSMRKTLATPDGGALKFAVERQTYPKFKEKNFSWLKELLYFGSRLLEAIICFIGFPNLYSTKIEKLKNQIRNILSDQHNNDGCKIQSLPIKSSYQLKAYLHDAVYKTHIIEKRQHNYNLLKIATEKLGLKCLFPQLPDGCVPQYFVLIDEQKKLLLSLREHGIGAVNWPGSELPQEITNRKVEFPIANYLNQHLVMLPVHQSLKDKDIGSIIDLLKIGSKLND